MNGKNSMVSITVRNNRLIFQKNIASRMRRIGTEDDALFEDAGNDDALDTGNIPPDVPIKAVLRHFLKILIIICYVNNVWCLFHSRTIEYLMYI